MPLPVGLLPTDFRTPWLFDWRASDLSLTPRKGNTIAQSRSNDGTGLTADAVVARHVANQPRYEWATNPVTGLLEPTLLLEGARPNTLIQSVDLTNAAFSPTAVTSRTLNVTGPDNVANSACTIIASGANMYVEQISGTSLTAGQSGVVSLFVKPSSALGAAYVWIGDLGDAVNHWSWYKLSDMSIGSQSSSTAFPAVLDANGFYRIAVKYTATNTYNQRIRFGFSRGNGGTDSVAADALAFFGPMGETNASFPSSYVPTGAASITRAADVASAAFNASPAQLAATGVTIYDDIIVGRPANADANYADLLAVGSANIPTNGLLIISTRAADAGTNSLLAGMENAGSLVSQSYINLAYSIADRLERVLTVTSGGVATLSVSKNGAAFQTGVVGVSASWPASFDSAVVSFNGTGANAGTMRRRAVRIASGVQTPAYMQAA